MTEEDRRTWTTDAFDALGKGGAEGPIAGLVLIHSRLASILSSAFPLVGTVTTIGRESDNQLCIQEGAVSRYHARIERRSEGFVIVDCGSTNGTLVNGRRVDQHRLAEHDVVRIGDTVYRFAPAQVDRYAAYRLTGEKDILRAPAHGIVEPLLVGGMQIDLLLDQIAKVARTNLSVVVHGESGTGKELVARELHRWSFRKGQFQAINCAALPSNLLESELFGYRRGAFTGATQDKVGLVQSANGGTLFLDEIGDMPLEAQAKLLRVLQEREVLPLGATMPVKVDVRVVAATHRNLDAAVAEGRFRGDLLARLREVPVEIPSLRQRREDLCLLVRHFLKRAGRPDGQPTLAYMLALAHYDFPYNVRELESAVKLSVALAEGQELDLRHLPTTVQTALEGHGARVGAVPTPPGAPASPAPPTPASRPPVRHGEATYDRSRIAPSPRPAPPPPDEPETLTSKHAPVAPDETELRRLLAEHRGNIAAIGRELGKERMQIHRWLRRYNIDVEQYRS